MVEIDRRRRRKMKSHIFVTAAVKTVAATPMIVLISLTLVCLVIHNALYSTILFAQESNSVDTRSIVRGSFQGEPYKNRICRSTIDYNHVTNGAFVLFSAPRPSDKIVPAALLAWKAEIQSNGSVVVFTNGDHDISMYNMAGIYTVCVEHTDEGLPRFDRMMDRMNHILHRGTVAFVNADIVPTPGTYATLRAAMATIQRQSPLELRQPTKVFQPFRDTGNHTDAWFAVSIRTNVDANGTQTPHLGGGFDFWAWNLVPPKNNKHAASKNNNEPLLPFPIPPFRFPYATYDNWLLDMMIETAQRAVLDLSPVVTLLHQQHKRLGGTQVAWMNALEQGVSGVYLNRHLAHTNPPNGVPVKHIWSFGHAFEAPYTLQRTKNDKMQIARRPLWSNVPDTDDIDPRCLQQQGFWKCKTIQTIEQKTREFNYKCQGIPLLDRNPGGNIARNALAHWRYTIERQLQARASPSGFVLLTAVNYEYRGHLRNFMCNLERVGLVDNVVVAALDAAVYRWGVERGIPMFLPQAVAQAMHRYVSDGYGGAAFRSLTKLKSTAVLEVLDAGYSVVWSDVDITWFVHPFGALDKYIQADSGVDFIIQSNSPFVENSAVPATPHASVKNVSSVPHDGPQRINSGLYVARNTPSVRNAFETIVGHARRTERTEQFSFDQILCEKEPSIHSDTFCTFQPRISVWRRFARFFQAPQSPIESLRVQFLHRFEYPNGAVLVGKNNTNVYTLGRIAFEKTTGHRLLAAHNNWIVGEDEKQTRQREAGWWFSPNPDSCIYLGRK